VAQSLALAASTAVSVPVFSDAAGARGELQRVLLGGEPGQERDGLLFVTAGADGVVPLRYLIPEARLGSKPSIPFLSVGCWPGYRRAGHVWSEVHALDAAA